MSSKEVVVEKVREPVLSPVDRVSELLFGLFMALTFVGAVSVAKAGREEIRAMFAAALGCNLAWGLVDAVMYLVRTITNRGRSLTLVRSVRDAPDAETGRRLIERSLSQRAAVLVSSTEAEGIRAADRGAVLPAEATEAGMGRLARRPRDLSDCGRVDLSRRVALRVDNGRCNGKRLSLAPLQWRCCSSGDSRWGVTRVMAAGEADS